MKLTFRDVIEFLVLPIMSIGVYALVDMNRSVNQLNIQVGVVLEKIESGKKDLEKLERRVEKLENMGVNFPTNKEN